MPYNPGRVWCGGPGLPGAPPTTRPLEEVGMYTERLTMMDRVTALLGYSELLLEGTYGELTPEQEEVVRKIVDAAYDVRDIIRREGAGLSYD